MLALSIFILGAICNLKHELYTEVRKKHSVVEQIDYDIVRSASKHKHSHSSSSHIGLHQ